jgi:hypothetical protein
MADSILFWGASRIHGELLKPGIEVSERTVSRECLDHVVVPGEAHLRRIVGNLLDYYHRSRTHLALESDELLAKRSRHSRLARITH